PERDLLALAAAPEPFIMAEVFDESRTTGTRAPGKGSEHAAGLRREPTAAPVQNLSASFHKFVELPWTRQERLCKRPGDQPHSVGIEERQRRLAPTDLVRREGCYAEGVVVLTR